MKRKTCMRFYLAAILGAGASVMPASGQTPGTGETSPVEIPLEVIQPEGIQLEENQLIFEPLITEETEKLPLPDPSDVILAAELYMNEGYDALDRLPFFSKVIPFESLNSYSCGIVVPLTIRAVAHNVDPDGTEGLLERVNTILSAPVADRRGPAVALREGDGWSLPVPEIELAPDMPPADGMIDLPEELQIQLDPVETGDTEPLLKRTTHQPSGGIVLPEILTASTALMQPSVTEPLVGSPAIPLFRQIRNNAPTLYEAIPQVYAEAGPRRDFDRLCSRTMPELGIDPNTEFAYRVKDNFYIYYHFCGGRNITQQKTVTDKTGFVIARENGTFPYKYPDGSVAIIRQCQRYTINCAPTHVQMIAADLTYARQMFIAHGFDVPAGGMTSVAPEIPVHITQDDDRSTAHLGRIWLHEPLGDGGRKMRWLAFHEYFHLVQFTHRADLSFVQGLHNWSSKPKDIVSWMAPPQDLSMTSFFWGNLESMAAWAADTLIEDYPSYELADNEWNDSRGYPFFNGYASLVYGYMSQRFGGHSNYESLREMARFVKDYLTPISSVTPYDGYKWAQIQYLELYLASKGTSLAEFVEDYHKNQLYSLYKESPEGGQPFRWAYLLRNNRQPWAWPPRFAELPVTDSLVKIGFCGTGNLEMRKRNGKPLTVAGSTSQELKYTCTIRMAPAGAALLRLPLYNDDLPSRINVRATAILTDGSGERTAAAPEVILIPTALGSNAGTDVNDVEAVTSPIYFEGGLKGSTQALVSYGPSPRHQRAGLNAAMLIVRYPDFWDRFKEAAADSEDVSVGGQRPYTEDPITMTIEIQGIW